jgi:putative thioredoxin
MDYVSNAEKIAAQSKGGFILAKLNAPNFQAMVRNLNIQQIPTTCVIHQGKVVDHFIGVLAMPEFRKLLEAVTGKTVEADVDEATEEVSMEEKSIDSMLMSLVTAEHGAAQDRYTELLDYSDQKLIAKFRARILAGLALNALKDFNNDNEQRVTIANEFIAKIKEEAVSNKEILQQLSHPEVSKAMITVAFTADKFAAEKAGTISSIASLLEANPNDHAARYHLAVLLFLDGSHKPAIKEAAKLLRKAKKDWENGKAKHLLLRFVEATAEDPETNKYAKLQLANSLNI